MKLLEMSKTISLMQRKENSTLIQEKNFNVKSILTNDLEIHFVKTKNIYSFITFFKKGYKYYLKKKYTKALEHLKNALLFKKGDFVTARLISVVLSTITKRRSTNPKFIQVLQSKKKAKAEGEYTEHREQENKRRKET